MSNVHSWDGDPCTRCGHPATKETWKRTEGGWVFLGRLCFGECHAILSHAYRRRWVR